MYNFSIERWQDCTLPDFSSGCVQCALAFYFLFWQTFYSSRFSFFSIAGNSWYKNWPGLKTKAFQPFINIILELSCAFLAYSFYKYRQIHLLISFLLF